MGPELNKPPTSAGYDAAQLALVRAELLELASILGDLLAEMVVVGGLVPSLLIDSAKAREPHVGTRDLDLGLELAILDTRRYQALPERLRRHGFEPDVNEEGNQTRQRWRHRGSGATVDFLMAPSDGIRKAGSLQSLESDLAAVVTPGLGLAFRDRQWVRLEGRTLTGEAVTREIPVCGVGAFVVLKALALRGRGENKDAYDLWYVLANYGRSVEQVAESLSALIDDPYAQAAVVDLREDFSGIDSIGPSRAARFIGRNDDEFKADVAGLVARLLLQLERR
ncbi:MAG: hypothetical protein AB7O37_18145 [Vicinamibacteria bacterium]